MREPILNVLIAALGMAVVLGLWYVLQMYLRYKSGCGKDRDLLEFMAHGCAGCKGPGTCHSDPAKEHHHEAV
jgi:hypothetical protein